MWTFPYISVISKYDCKECCPITHTVFGALTLITLVTSIKIWEGSVLKAQGFFTPESPN